MSKRYENLIGELQELLQEEHGGCEESTCDISCAMAHDFWLWAIYLFDSSGAASEQFDKLFKRLPKKKFAKDAEAERVEMCKIETSECPHCNAVTWEPDYVTDLKGFVHCGSCARKYPRPKKLHFDGTDLVDAGLPTKVEPVAHLAPGNQALGPLFESSFEMLEALKNAKATLWLVTQKNPSQKERLALAEKAQKDIAALVTKIERAA